MSTENTLMIYALPCTRTATRLKCHTNIENIAEVKRNQEYVKYKIIFYIECLKMYERVTITPCMSGNT